MTITCSACGCPFDPGDDRTVVACDFCGHRTFNPYVDLGGEWWNDERDDEDKDDDAPRALILAEMIAESEALGKGVPRPWAENKERTNP